MAESLLLENQSLTPTIDECQKHIENAYNVIQQINSLMNNPEQYIYDYFEEIKRQVDLRRETLKQEIDECSDLIITDLEKTKSESMQNIKTLQIYSDIATSTVEIDKLNVQLNNIQLFEDTTKHENLLSVILASEDKFKKMLTLHQDFILRNQKFSFEFNRELKTPSIFGKVLIDWKAMTQDQGSLISYIWNSF